MEVNLTERPWACTPDGTVADVAERAAAGTLSP